jgi:hypothetical protein
MRRLVLGVLVLGASVAPRAGSSAPSYPTASPICASAIPDIDATEPALGEKTPLDPKTAKLPIRGFFLSPSAPNPRKAHDTPIELTIKPGAPATGYSLKRGQPIPITLTIENRSNKALSVLKPMDGSKAHMRFPWYELFVRDEATQKTYRWAELEMRCGNVNASTSDDHLELAPGASSKVPLDGWGEHLLHASITKPGKYTVWVAYAFCGYDVKGLPLGTNVVRTDAHVGVHTSNPVSVTVQ